MATSLRLNTADSRRIKRYLKALTPASRNSVVREALEGIAFATSLDARTKRIIRGRSRKAKPVPKRLTWRSGDLARSISVDLSELYKRSIVGTPIEYAPQHEQGLSPYPRRPFLKPASDSVLKRQAKRIFRVALLRARRVQ